MIAVPTNSSTTTAATEVSLAGLIAGLTVLFLVIIAVVVVVVVYCIWKKKKGVAPTADTSKQNVEGIEVQPPPKEPLMLEKPDGRETITPSAMSAHIQSRSGSHGKLKQVLGTEYTMTGETSVSVVNGVDESTGQENAIDANAGQTDDAKLHDDSDMNVTDTDSHELEKSPRKLPPITEKPTSPTDTRLDKPLPPIRWNSELILDVRCFKTKAETVFQMKDYYKQYFV